MHVKDSPKRFGSHGNAFGFLRLLLASLVVVSHTPELTDGNRKREVLTNVFHSISFGELAVDGFFILSGFLITASYLNSTSTASYLRKRVARIYPAYAVSSLICVILIAPLAGGHFFAHGAVRGFVGAIGRIFILVPPHVTGVFAGTPYAAQNLNGAAWTIQYEFLCYLLIAGLGKLGMLRSAKFVGSIAFVCVLVSCFAPPAVADALNRLPLQDYIILGNRLDAFRLVGMYMTGSAFYALRDRIPISTKWSLAVFILLCGGLFFAPTANITVAVFGSYLLFSIASLASNTFISRINDQNDISYGVYLYAWPIEKLLMWWGVSSSLLMVGLETWLLTQSYRVPGFMVSNLFDEIRMWESNSSVKNPYSAENVGGRLHFQNSPV